jgi:hypothetical protein
MMAHPIVTKTIVEWPVPVVMFFDKPKTSRSSLDKLTTVVRDAMKLSSKPLVHP